MVLEFVIQANSLGLKSSLNLYVVKQVIENN
jgi:hypothetical protein